MQLGARWRSSARMTRGWSLGAARKDTIAVAYGAHHVRAVFTMATELVDPAALLVFHLLSPRMEPADPAPLREGATVHP